MAVALVSALICGSCAVFASKAEYQLVRQMQLETDPIVRADALVEYDRQFKTTGRIAAQMADLRTEIDEGFWAYADSQGLEQEHAEAYLTRFPEGIHAGDAQRRLDQIRYFAEQEAARLEAQRQAEADERRRVEEENERQRARVRGGLERWLQTALDMRWGATLDALTAMNASFREQWTGDPAPVCVANTCRRTLEAFYFFSREGQTRLDRSISLVLQVDMRGGRVYRLTAYYTGRGFVDWLEMGSDEPIAEETQEQREMARDAMIAMVQGAVMTAIPAASDVETDEAGVLLRLTGNDLVINLREFPADYTAGRVDGVEISFTGELNQATAPTPDEED